MSLRGGRNGPQQAWEKRVGLHIALQSVFLSNCVTTKESEAVRGPRVQRDRRSPEPSQRGAAQQGGWSSGFRQMEYSIGSQEVEQMSQESVAPRPLCT